MSGPPNLGSAFLQSVDFPRSERIGRRLLFVIEGCYLDESNGATVASRDLLELFASRGFEVKVFCGTAFDDRRQVDFLAWLGNRPNPTTHAAIEPWTIVARPGSASNISLSINRVMVTIDLGAVPENEPSSSVENSDLSDRFADFLEQAKSDVVVGFGGSQVMVNIFARARAAGMATAFLLHNFAYQTDAPFAGIDRVIVASQFSSVYYREVFGLHCEQLSYLIDLARCRRDRSGPGYLTFVNPAIEKGVYPFARIADELGKRRPDIPILVVESRGTEATVAGCGLELREHGTVNFMAHTSDPRDFWGVTKVCLLPSVWWENQPLVAVEAMVNGIPVIGSDRGGIPETLGEAGIVLPLPDRITQATRMLPTAEEVEPWVQAVIRLWDDAEFYEEHRRRALAEAKRWDPDVVGPMYVEFFENLKPGSKPAATIPPGRAKSVVLVPYLGSIEPECEESLRKLEASGVRVVRSGGNSAIDVARNRMASEALHDGAESIFFIDSDIGFDPQDALRLLARPEPVVSGVYAKKGNRAFASIFADGVDEVVFGAHAFGLYPLKYAATGFLRIKASALRRMIEVLDLPDCNAHWGKSLWPFFQPMVVPQGDGLRHYLGEDWAFSHRLGQVGVTPMADTSIRLWHYGRYGYGWEDVGIDSKRFATYTHRFGG